LLLFVVLLLTFVVDCCYSIVRYIRYCCPRCLLFVPDVCWCCSCVGDVVVVVVRLRYDCCDSIVIIVRLLHLLICFNLWLLLFCYCCYCAGVLLLLMDPIDIYSVVDYYIVALLLLLMRNIVGG